MEKLDALREEQMAEWERLGSQEHYKELHEKALRESHADIDPPWED